MRLLSASYKCEVIIVKDSSVIETAELCLIVLQYGQAKDKLCY